MPNGRSHRHYPVCRVVANIGVHVRRFQRCATRWDCIARFCVALCMLLLTASECQVVQLVPVVCALWQRSASLFQTVPGSAMEQGYGLAREPTFEWFTANLTWAGHSAFARLWTSRPWTLFTNEATEIVLAIRSSHKLLSCVCWLSVLSCCSYNRTDNPNSDFVHTELTVGCTRPYGITWSPPTSSTACW